MITLLSGSPPNTRTRFLTLYLPLEIGRVESGHKAGEGGTMPALSADSRKRNNPPFGRLPKLVCPRLRLRRKFESQATPDLRHASQSFRTASAIPIAAR